MRAAKSPRRCKRPGCRKRLSRWIRRDGAEHCKRHTRAS